MIVETLRHEFEDHSYYSDYCNSVIECTDSEGNLSEPNVLKLLSDHGASYHEFIENNGVDYHVNTVLSWLGY